MTIYFFVVWSTGTEKDSNRRTYTGSGIPRSRHPWDDKWGNFWNEHGSNREESKYYFAELSSLSFCVIILYIVKTFK